MRRVSFSCLQSNNQKCSAKQFRGDWLKVAPAAKRQFSAAADSSITYVCIQVKENSLGGFTANDEPQKTKRLCRVGRAFLRILLWQPIDRQSVADSAVAEAFFAGNPLCSLLRRSALNHDAFPLLPRPVNQPIGQRRRTAVPPNIPGEAPSRFPRCPHRMRDKSHSR